MTVNVTSNDVTTVATSARAFLETNVTLMFLRNVTAADDSFSNHSSSASDFVTASGHTDSNGPNSSAGSGGVIPSFNVTSVISAAGNDTLTSTATSVLPDVYHSFLNLTSTPSAYVTSANTTAVSDNNGSAEVLDQRIADAIDFWVPPFLFFIGCVANVLVIMVMQSRDFRHMSTSFYMCLSSIFDMISLLVSLPAHYLYVNFPEVFDSVRDAHPMCGFFNIFGWGSSDMGVLLTVAMTTERSLAIKFPLKAPTLCTVKRAKIVSVCLFLLEVLKVGHLAIYSRVASKEVTAYLCDVDLESDPSYAVFYTKYWPYVHNIFLVVAFVLIIIGNIFITVHVKRSEESKDMGEGAKSSGGKGMTSRSRQLSVMLIIDSATIVLCTLPFAIYIVVANAFRLFDDTPQGKGERSLAFAVVFYLLYVNRCANFFLYCVSGARFRQTLKNILTGSSAKARRKSPYATGVTNTRLGTASATYVGESEGSRISMNSMGPSTISGKKGTNEESNRVSMNPNGPTSSPPGTAGNVRSKLERHYGYGKNGR